MQHLVLNNEQNLYCIKSTFHISTIFLLDKFTAHLFRFLPATPLHLVEKEGEKSQHRVSLLLKNNEIFGAKDDFRINRSYLTPMGKLCMEVPTEILRDAVMALTDYPVAGVSLYSDVFLLVFSLSLSLKYKTSECSKQ